MNYTIVKPKNFDKLITYTHNINSIEKYVLVVQINQKYQMIYLENGLSEFKLFCLCYC